MAIDILESVTFTSCAIGLWIEAATMYQSGYLREALTHSNQLLLFISTTIATNLQAKLRSANNANSGKSFTTAGKDVLEFASAIRR